MDDHRNGRPRFETRCTGDMYEFNRHEAPLTRLRSDHIFQKTSSHCQSLQPNVSPNSNGNDRHNVRPIHSYEQHNVPEVQHTTVRQRLQQCRPTHDVGLAMPPHYQTVDQQQPHPHPAQCDDQHAHGYYNQEPSPQNRHALPNDIDNLTTTGLPRRLPQQGHNDVSVSEMLRLPVQSHKGYESQPTQISQPFQGIKHQHDDAQNVHQLHHGFPPSQRKPAVNVAADHQTQRPIQQTLTPSKGHHPYHSQQSRTNDDARPLSFPQHDYPPPQNEPINIHVNQQQPLPQRLVQPSHGHQYHSRHDRHINHEGGSPRPVSKHIELTVPQHGFLPPQNEPVHLSARQQQPPQTQQKQTKFQGNEYQQQPPQTRHSGQYDIHVYHGSHNVEHTQPRQPTDKGPPQKASTSSMLVQHSQSKLFVSSDLLRTPSHQSVSLKGSQEVQIDNIRPILNISFHPEPDPGPNNSNLSFLNLPSKEDVVIKKPNKRKIHTGKHLLCQFHNMLAQLKQERDALRLKLDCEETEWCGEIMKIQSTKAELLKFQEMLTEDYLKDLCGRLKAQKKFRMRKRKQRQNDVKVAEKKRKKMHEEIDEVLAAEIQEKENKNKEAEFQKEIDLTLSEVRMKKREMSQQHNLYRTLRKLRLLRQEAASNSVTLQDEQRFDRELVKLEEFVRQRSNMYREEEKTLQVMLEGEQSELRAQEDEKMLKRKAKAAAARLKSQMNDLFGEVDMTNDEASWLKFYNQSNENLESLINVRRQWDAFIVEKEDAEGSAIPVNWVPSGPPSNAAWAVALGEEAKLSNTHS